MVSSMYFDFKVSSAKTVHFSRMMNRLTKIEIKLLRHLPAIFEI